ncbi:MAG: carboxypeptidase-like regulatory domain-containing protein [Polyangiaceae bacterium]
MVAAATCVGACSKKGPAPAGSGSGPAASASGPPVVLAVPVHEEKVRKAVNPKGRPIYSGPSGGVRGRVRVSGPPATTRDEVLAKMPEKCSGAKSFYAPSFREGAERALADVLVTVTGYDAFVPAPNPVRAITVANCAYGARTFALTFGQKLEVRNTGTHPQMPKLLGAKSSAVMVAVPGGDAVPLFPAHAGRFALVDEMYGGIQADVFVLQYATFAVTGSDGRYEIRNVPVGKLKLNALLPSTMTAKTQSIEIEADKTLEVDLVLDVAPPAPPPSSSAPVPPPIP